jgi:hypothetical protein
VAAVPARSGGAYLCFFGSHCCHVEDTENKQMPINVSWSEYIKVNKLRAFLSD